MFTLFWGKIICIIIISWNKEQTGKAKWKSTDVRERKNYLKLNLPKKVGVIKMNPHLFTSQKQSVFKFL